MPLLMCPNDNASMQTVARNGVEFDMCPTCRGVWLDRGELENLMNGVRAELGPDTAAVRTAPTTRANSRNDHDERGEYGERGEQAERTGRGRQRRGFDLFDIFD